MWASLLELKLRSKNRNDVCRNNIARKLRNIMVREIAKVIFRIFVLFR